MVHIPPGTRRHTGPAITGVVAALLMAGCSTFGTTDPTANCASAPENKLGFGAGPVYLSGQTRWYAGGQAAVLMVDSTYSGPLQVRASEFGGDGSSQITLTPMNLDPAALAGLTDKERQHGSLVVSGVQTAQGGLELDAVPSSPLSRAWFGQLSTSGPGCFALHVTGTGLTEDIVFAVHAGPAPPG